MLLSNEQISDAKVDAVIAWTKTKKFGITPREAAEFILSDESKILMDNAILEAQLAYSEPLIRADERAKAAQEILGRVDSELKLYVSLYVQEPMTYIHIPVHEWNRILQRLKKQYEVEG